MYFWAVLQVSKDEIQWKLIGLFKVELLAKDNITIGHTSLDYSSNSEIGH